VVRIFDNYSDCQNNIPIGFRSNCLGMGAYANRRKFVTDLRGRPQIDNKDCTGGDDIRLRGSNSSGAARISWMSAKDLWRIDEGQVIIPVDRIRTHTQTKHIYDIYYRISVRI